MVVAFYPAWCLTMGSGLDLAANDEMELSARLAAMFGVVGAVHLVAVYERTRRRRSAVRERALLEGGLNFLRPFMTRRLRASMCSVWA